MKNFLLISCILILTACSTLNGDNVKHDNVAKTTSTWDFDHNIQIKKTQLSTNRYYLEIIPTTKTHFNLLATVLLRHSLQLCKQYGYKIEVLGGVESFNDTLVATNYLVGPLRANIECPEK